MKNKLIQLREYFGDEAFRRIDNNLRFAGLFDRVYMFLLKITQ